MNNAKHILLICYAFPPYPGIGGRRWAKFSKYLAAKNCIVHVICAKKNSPDTSLFMKDVIENPNIRIYQLPPKYPYSLTKNVVSFMDKVSYRIHILFLKLITDSNYFDRGINWKKQLLHKSNELISSYNIKNVIATGAPFSLLYFVTDLKKRFNGINIIADMRDPWTWGNAYGMKIISIKRKKEEERREAIVVKECNVITVPTDEMRNSMSQLYPGFVHKIQVIPHGYDPADISPQQKKEADHIRLVFYGTFYSGIEMTIKEVMDLIAGKRCTLHLFGAMDETKRKFLEKNLNSNVKIHDPLPPAELFNKFSAYDFALIIQPEVAKDFITTKIIEIIYTKTPIILITDNGKLSEFITTHNLGIHLLPENLNTGFKQVFDFPQRVFSLESFPIEQYSFESLTDIVMSYFM